MEIGIITFGPGDSINLGGRINPSIKVRTRNSRLLRMIYRYDGGDLKEILSHVPSFNTRLFDSIRLHMLWGT